MRTSTRPSPARPRLARALACLLPALLALGMLAPGSEARTGYPRLLNIYLSNGVTPEDLQELARWDVLALDVDFPIVNPGAIDQIRALNPDILILGYIPINGTWVEGNLQPPQSVAYRYWAGVEAGNFWLRNIYGGIVSDWPAKGTTNLTPNSPVNALGQQYWQWFAHFVNDEVWEHGASEWDGVFLDDVWNNISWLNAVIGPDIDSNRDWVADDAAQLDAWWSATTDSCTALVRTLLGPDVPIMGNGANTSYGALNGTMIESFPYNGAAEQGNPYSYAWTKWMQVDIGSYFVGLDRYLASPLKLETINMKWPGVDDQPDTTGRFHAHVRLGLGSTLLGDGYFSLDNTIQHHSSTWWIPEYDTYLGPPLGPAYTYTVGGLGIWRRDFAAASVVVNPNNATLVAQSGLPTIEGWDAYIGPPIVDPPPPDTLAPAEIDNYSGWAVTSRTAFLRWQAVGDDGKTGRATSYQIRYATGLGNRVYEGATWESATEVPNGIVPSWAGAYETLTIAGLEPDTWYYFAVRAVDEVGNVGSLQYYNYRIQTPLVDPPTTDEIPPAAITDLEMVSVDSTSAIVRWTSPGDDGTTGKATFYRGRIAEFPLTEQNWDVATTLFWLPTPANSGSMQVATLSGLTPGKTYYVGLRAVDEVPNLGALGNVPSFTTPSSGPPPPPPPPPPDTKGPYPVLDLIAFSSTENVVYLRFTAPDDDEGTVTAYQIRYTTATSFPESAWDTATAAAAPVPASPGTVQTHAVGGLTPATTYRFRLRSVDDSGNWSALSDTASGRTTEPPPPPPPPPGDVEGPTTVADLVVFERGETWMRLTFTAPADAGGTVVEYDLRRADGDSLPEAQWSAAAVIPIGQPASPGLREYVRVEGLTPGTLHAFRIRSRDDAGNWSALGNTASGSTVEAPPPPPPPPPADTTPPGDIVTLVATVTDTFNVTLTWTAPGDDAAEGQADHYDLRRRIGTLSTETWGSATPIAGAPIPAPSNMIETLVLEGLPRDTTLAFALVAYDDAGNAGAMSNVAFARIATPPPPPDTQPPGAVESLAGDTDTPGSVSLAWDAAPEPDVAFYRLYRGRGETMSLGLYRDNLANAALNDTQVVPGRQYAYAVTAVDASGNEGPRSAIVRVRVPVEPWLDLPEGLFGIGDPWPNPASGSVSMRVETGSAMTVTLEVFDISGRLVCGPRAASLGAGGGEVAWDGCDASGRRVPRGMYFLRLRGDAASALKRVWMLP